MNVNAILAEMIKHAELARRGVMTQYHERQLRGLFEQLNEGITSGRFPLPDAWRPHT